MQSISPPARRLVTASFLGAMGDGAFMTTSAIYFTRVAGLTPEEFGLGLTIAGAVGLFVGVPLGHLADRRGPRGTTATMVALNGLAVAGYLVVRSFPAFLFMACCFVVCQRGGAAARQALVAGLLDSESRVRTQAAVRSVNNIGLAVGAALAAGALQKGTSTVLSAVLVLDAVSFLASAAVILSLPVVPPGPARVTTDEPRRNVFQDGPFVAFTAVSAVLSLQFVLTEVVLPLWIINRTGASATTVTVVFVINAISVVLFQVRISRRVLTVRHAVAACRLSGAVLFIACALFALSAQGPPVVRICLLVAAALAHVVGEMLFSAASWTIGFGMAPDGKQGQYQGFYFTGYAATAMVAPLLLTSLLITWGTPGWFVLGSGGLIAVCLVGRIVAQGENARPTAGGGLGSRTASPGERAPRLTRGEEAEEAQR